jgi:hypothetical protein
MARFVFTAARRRALRKAQRASARKRRGHKVRRHAVRSSRRRATHRRKKGYVFTKARRAALRKAQLANRHHSRIGRKGARIRKFKAELRDLGYGEYAMNPARRKSRRVRVTPGSAAARLAKWRWHHNPSDTLAGEMLPGIMANPFRKGKLRATKRRIGKVFKRKGRFYIVARLRNGVKVARPWSKSRRR